MNHILYNARIYTFDPHLPVAEAIAISNDQIVALGSNDEVLNLPLSGYNRQNLDGKTVLPGLTDSHLHLQHTALAMSVVDCETETKEECLTRIKERVAATPAGGWIFGHGWNQNRWADGYGTLKDLDLISTLHPIFLTAKSLHAAWVNSTALRHAGIEAATHDPQGGIIGRTKNGALNGILFESAYLLVQEQIPHQSIPKIADAIEQAQHKLAQMGITSVHDFDGVDCFSALQMLEREKRLKMRVLKSIPFSNLDAALEFGVTTGFGSSLLKIGSIKLFADGALGPQTAAMLAPYRGSEDDYGTLLLSQEEILNIGKRSSPAGLSLAIHAIGDKANQVVLAAFSELRSHERELGMAQPLHRIEHAQLLNPQLIPLFAVNKIHASVQPIHQISDIDIADRYWGERAMYAFPFQSLLASGAQLVFGSDSPVEIANPFIGIYAATTRLSMNTHNHPNSWYPHEKISLNAAVRAYTIQPAILAGWEQCKGRLHLKEAADLIVLKEDIFTVEPERRKELLPCATMAAGEWVWQEEA